MMEYILDILTYLENKAAHIVDILDECKPGNTFLKRIFIGITLLFDDLWWWLWKHW